MASINLQGDTSGAITISAPSVAGSNTLTLPATTQTLATQNALGVRNLIINGDMRIAQRGTSKSINTSGYHTLDRWRMAGAGGSTDGTWTMSQDTDVPTGQGFANSLKLDCTTADTSIAAGDFTLLQTILEGQNLQHLKKGTSSAESITMSFWIKSNKIGTYTLEVYDNDNSRFISYAYTVDAADTWEKKTITFAGDTTGAIVNDNSSGITLQWWLTSGTNYTSGTFGTTWQTASVAANRVSSSNVNLADSTSNYINITGVQLEVGDTATPFEHRPYDMELARCKRYYEKSYPIGTFAGSTVVAGRRQMGGSNVGATTSFLSGPMITFEVEKRTTPTIVLYDTAGTSGKCVRYQLGLGDSQNENINTADIGSTGLYTYSANGASRSGVGVHFTADAEL